MEEELEVSGAEYSCGEDVTGNRVVPLSYTYTPFSIEIPNNYGNASHPSSLHHPHRPTPHITSEDQQAGPSVCTEDYNTHSSSCSLYGELLSSGLSQCFPVCYPRPYPFLCHTTASHTWTPEGAVQYDTSSAAVCDAVARIPSEDKQLFSTLESSRHLYQADSGHRVQPTFPPVSPDMQTAGQHKESMRGKTKKSCHCTKSHCLKLYCDCFANKEICSDCSCINCYNNTEHATDRDKAITRCLKRNLDAFRSKVSSSVRGDVKGSRTRGCNCKSSGCLKNYCECYKAVLLCSSICKCVGCSNYSRGEEQGSAVEKTTHSDNKNTHRRTNVSCVTDAVAEAVCRCLLAQAEQAERESLSPVQAEEAILEEFGYCLTQILDTFKHTHR